MIRALGVNTWVWVSPLDDARLTEIAARAKQIGYDLLELPVENPGDWDAHRALDTLSSLGMSSRIVGAMGEGRDLLDDWSRAATQDYLRHCIDQAEILGSPTVAGPFTARTGRVWRMSPEERRATITALREALKPVAEYAVDRGVTLAIEPLNRYETSLINTVDQALDALDPLLGNGVGLALDSYHLNIEEKRPADAIVAAAEHLCVMQVCGNDRGAVGADHIDWSGTLDALDTAGYAGPLTLESFTGDNDTIATAASIWRPLADTQDELARLTYDYLTELQQRRSRPND